MTRNSTRRLLLATFCLVLAGCSGLVRETRVDTQRIETGRLECTSGWKITGYYAPLEQDFTGPAETVMVTDVGSLSFPADFLADIRVQGWGLTRAGWSLGHFGGRYHKAATPLDRFGYPLRLGTVAVDPAYVPFSSRIMIQGIDQLSGREFTADDEGSSIRGKHLDIYTGEGRAALAEALAITRIRPDEFVSVCVIR